MHDWPFPISLTTLLAFVVFFYVQGWLHLRKVIPQIINWRHMAALIGGLVAIWGAAGSPLARMDHQRLSIHMVQHLLLMAVASPLILLGRPALCLSHSMPEGIVWPVLWRHPERLLGKITTHLVFCWIASTMTVIGWHLPVAFALGQHSTVWHEFQHASFLLAGLLFWWPVIQARPGDTRSAKWSLPLYLFLATLPCDALSAFLAFCGRVVYPSYLSGTRSFPTSALQDQEFAGVLMWVCVTFIYMVPALALTVRLLSPASMEPQMVAK